MRVSKPEGLVMGNGLANHGPPQAEAIVPLKDKWCEQPMSLAMGPDCR